MDAAIDGASGPVTVVGVSQGLRDAGVDGRIVDAIDTPLRRRIDRAYDGPLPRVPANAQRRNVTRSISAKIGERREARAVAKASPPD